ncbi:NADPH-dependent oxidoreductase [Patescibacteria group bacterium]|nr:MAG: NADPH-dependent oxidoreductase [Patescibacteria group bacterium]
MPHVQIILASTRDGRIGDKVTAWVAEKAKARTDFTSELVDLRDWPLPHFNDPKLPGTGEYSFDYTKKWSEHVQKADGFIIVTCEYNHGYPGVLKNALDHLYKEWNGKPVAFVSYGGVAGGTRAVEQLHQVVNELRMVSVHDEVNIPFVAKAFDAGGTFLQEDVHGPKLEKLFVELADKLKRMA